MQVFDPKKSVREMLDTQRFAVLATQCDRKPHTNLIAFAATSDLQHVVFATDRNTRKFARISDNPNVALLVDNRTNRASDLTEATAVTASGNAGETKDQQRIQLAALLLGKHPYLRQFLAKPDCSLIAVTVHYYEVVTRFQSVAEFRP